jgi:hypothetical protein
MIFSLPVQRTGREKPEDYVGFSINQNPYRPPYNLRSCGPPTAACDTNNPSCQGRRTEKWALTSAVIVDVAAFYGRIREQCRKALPISYDSNLALEWPRILTVWFNCSILSGFFRTVTGLICKILSSISLSG